MLFRRAGLILGLLAALTAARAEVFTLQEATIADMQRAMDAHALTSVQLVTMYLNRIQIYDRDTVKLNAVAQVNPRVLEEAAAMDALRAQGTVLGPLHGVPVLVKDSFDVKGLASAAGATPLKNLIATADAPVVKALKAAGAVILGKTNMWPFAYANENIPVSSYAWGLTKNPYTLRTDDFGGSSIGSSAAVAANLCAFAMGGDTGSSIRLPSARTALVGGRPSAFLVPASGTWPADASLDVIGPMARTVTDCALALDAVVFDDPEPLDTGAPASSSVRPETYTINLRTNALAGKVVGLPKPYIGKDGPPLDADVATLWAAAIANLQAAGATVKEIEWPFLHNYDQDTPEGLAHNYSTVGLTLDQFDLSRDREKADAYYFNQHLLSYDGLDFESVLDLPYPEGTPAPGDKIEGFKQVFRANAAKSFTELGYDVAFAAFRAWARRDIEDVMTAAGVDLVAFPATLWADFDSSLTPTASTFLNGTWEGSRLGLPEYVVPMGFSAASGTPQGMMILGRTYYTEAQILGYAYAFEQQSKSRRAPSVTPPLPGETIVYDLPAPPPPHETAPPKVRVRPNLALLFRRGGWRFEARGTVQDASALRSLRFSLNGRNVPVNASARWSVEIPWDKFWRTVRYGSRVANVTVLAKDVYGNTGATSVRVRIPRTRKVIANR